MKKSSPGSAAIAWWATNQLGLSCWQQANLLVDDRGRLSAVIDFGGVGVGDPACDLIASWFVLPTSSRDGFRAAVGSDAAEWERGRGWALSIALIQLPYYIDTNSAMAAGARHVVNEILAEHQA